MRAALLREGIVVLEEQTHRGHRSVAVTGAGAERTREIVALHVGDEAEIEVVADLPRVLRPRRCVGQMEREPGRLQVRYVLRGDEHVDDIVVAEDDHAVVVLATVCTSAAGEAGERVEGPWHVYLDEPLAGRAVIDGATGDQVPYYNVYLDLEEPLTRRGR